MKRSMYSVVTVFLLTIGFGHFAVARSPFPGEAQAIASAGSLAEARLLHTATLLNDGRVLVIGGALGSPVYRRPALGSAEVWDPATGEFSPAGTLAETRYRHTATLLADGRVLVIGGIDFGDSGSGPRASAEVWDPATGEFSPAGTLAETRYWHTATLLSDGRVLIVGGFVSSDAEPSARLSAELWDPATETFSPAEATPQVRVTHTATLVSDDRVLVVGGASFTVGLGPLDTALLWEPGTRTFELGGSLAEGRSGHTSTSLPDGSVLVVGGSRAGNLSSAESWDSSTETFRPEGSLVEARSGHTATLLADGAVLVVGGSGIGDVALASAERYDPETQRFTKVGSLEQPRMWHTATRLEDGNVLVVGGSEGARPLATAELYDPSTQRFTTVGSSPGQDALRRAEEVGTTGDKDFATRFPPELGGEPLEITSLSGREWRSLYDSGSPADAAALEAIADFVASIGVSIEDLSLASALYEPSPGNHDAIAAVRIRGADASEFVAPVIGLMLGDILEPESRTVSISGKTVLRVVDALLPGTYPRYVYATDDVVWLVEAEEPELSEIFAVLP